MAYVDPHDGTPDAVAAADRMASVLLRAGHPNEADEVSVWAHHGEVDIALDCGICYIDMFKLPISLADAELGLDAATAEDDGDEESVKAAQRVIDRIKHNNQAR